MNRNMGFKALLIFFITIVSIVMVLAGSDSQINGSMTNQTGNESINRTMNETINQTSNQTSNLTQDIANTFKKARGKSFPDDDDR